MEKTKDMVARIIKNAYANDPAAVAGGQLMAFGIESSSLYIIMGDGWIGLPEFQMLSVANWMRDREVDRAELADLAKKIRSYKYPVKRKSESTIPIPIKQNLRSIGDGVYEFYGYQIRNAYPSGGKAGKNKNITSTLRVAEPYLDHYNILKQFRYRVCDRNSYDAAEEKCMLYILSRKGTRK